MKASLFIVVSIAFIFGGCSTNPKCDFNIATRRVTILTEPGGAAVTQINPFGQPSTSLGLSPINDRSVVVVSKVTKIKNMSYSASKRLMEQVNNVVVRIEKDGYKPYFGTLKTEPDETVVHNIKLQPKEAVNN